MATEKLNRVYSNNLGTTLTTVYTAPAHASSRTKADASTREDTLAAATAIVTRVQ